MSTLLDDNLIQRNRRKSVYANWSNIPAAIVILGALFMILHWYGGDFLLLTGLSTHVGLELGFAIVLKFKLRKNVTRLAMGLLILGVITYRWFYPDAITNWNHPGIQLITYGIVLSAALTYYLAKKRLRAILLKNQ